MTLTVPALVPARDRFAELLLLGLLISATFLQKFGITIGDNQIPVGVFIVTGLTAAGFIFGKLGLKKERFALYLLLVGVVITTQALGPNEFSIFSLVYLIVIHMPYSMCLKRDCTRRDIELVYYRKIIIALALIGIIQFLMQFVIGYSRAFFLDTSFPQSFIIQGFHGLNPYRSGIYKSNGFFLNEASTFSQFLAIGLIIEMLHFKNWKIMALYLCGIVVTFSGTGLIILGLLTPAYLIQKRKYVVLMAIATVLLSAPLWAQYVGLQRTVDRVSEFSSVHSSGYARFISIFPTLRDFTFAQEDTAIFGMGAGSIKKIQAQVTYQAFDPTWGKIMFEYGLLGAAAYYLFIGYALYRTRHSAYIRFAMAIEFFLLGEFMLSPIMHGLMIAMLVWPSRSDDAKAAREQVT